MKIQKEKMKEWLIGLCVAGTLFCSCSDKSGEVIPTDYVNPFIGASTNIQAAGAYHGLGKHFQVQWFHTVLYKSVRIR